MSFSNDAVLEIGFWLTFGVEYRIREYKIVNPSVLKVMMAQEGMHPILFDKIIKVLFDTNKIMIENDKIIYINLMN